MTETEELTDKQKGRGLQLTDKHERTNKQKGRGLQQTDNGEELRRNRHELCYRRFEASAAPLLLDVLLRSV